MVEPLPMPIPMPPAAEPAAEQPSGRPSTEVPSSGPSSTEVPSADDVPLPTRVPGHHLSHDPTAAAGGAGDEADPLRPYHVHELLTRHALGIRRGRAESDLDDSERDLRPEGER